MNDLTETEWQAILAALHSDAFRLLMGAEEWDLTEEQEERLWDVIRRTEG